MNNNENHQSLLELIQPHIDKSIEELPEELSRMVEAVFSGLWNKMDAKYRYEFAVKRDYANDPANEEEIKYRRNLCSKINKVRWEIAEWEKMSHQGIPSEARIREVKLVALRAKLSELSELLELLELLGKPWERPPNLLSDVAKVKAALDEQSAPTAEEQDESGLSPKEQKIRAIEKFADELGYPRDAVPLGGKKKLMEKCKKEKSGLFGGGNDPFLDVWKDASKAGRIRIKNRERYLTKR